MSASPIGRDDARQSGERELKTGTDTGTVTVQP